MSIDITSCDHRCSQVQLRSRNESCSCLLSSLKSCRVRSVDESARLDADGWHSMGWFQNSCFCLQTSQVVMPNITTCDVDSELTSQLGRQKSRRIGPKLKNQLHWVARSQRVLSNGVPGLFIGSLLAQSFLFKVVMLRITSSHSFEVQGLPEATTGLW